MSWHVAETLAQREASVRLALVRRGYDCWLPMCRSREDKPVMPFFPGYLFVRLDGTMAPPRRDLILGLIDLVRFGDSLAFMPEETFAELCARIEPEPGKPIVLNPRQKFKKGEAVLILEGRGAGHEGIVRWSKDERIRVLLDSLAPRVLIDTSVESVRAVR